MQTERPGCDKNDKKTHAGKFIRITLVIRIFFFLGFTSIITGFILTILYAILPNQPSLNRVGTFFIFISIPLLLAGSYLLDRSDK